MDNFDIMMDEIKTKHPLTQVLFLADPESAELAASALKLGVYQYSKLPVSNEELEQLIESAIERRPAVENGSPAISKSRQCKLDNLIGCSPQSNCPGCSIKYPSLASG